MTTTRDRKELLCLASAASMIHGHFAEAGVRRAESFIPLAKIAKQAGKLCFGFDSFEGMSVHTKRDVLPNGKCRWPMGTLHTGGEAGLKRVLDLCEDAGLSDTVRVTRGWVPQCLDVVSKNTFAFVHLDLDQYAPTLAAAEFFWPRLRPGAILICHDVWAGDNYQASGGFHDFHRNLQDEIGERAPALHCMDEVPYGWIQKASDDPQANRLLCQS